MAALPDLKGKRILAVDDDAEVLQALTTVLKATGAEVTSARDGNAAVELCTAGQPDLMIVDIMMPKRSGFLVVEKIRSLKTITQPAVIIITANPGHRHKTYAESLGVADYINKPFTVERLMKSLSKIFVPQENETADKHG